jgi:hypothetical protein
MNKSEEGKEIEVDEKLKVGDVFKDKDDFEYLSYVGS